MKRRWNIVVFCLIFLCILCDLYGSVQENMQQRKKIHQDELLQIAADCFHLDLQVYVGDLLGYQYHDVKAPLVIRFALPEESYKEFLQAPVFSESTKINVFEKTGSPDSYEKMYAYQEGCLYGMPDWKYAINAYHSRKASYPEPEEVLRWTECEYVFFQRNTGLIEVDLYSRIIQFHN